MPLQLAVEGRREAAISLQFTRAKLGIELQIQQSAGTAVVGAVHAESPAHGAIKPGARLIQINGKEISALVTHDDWLPAISALKSAHPLTLTFEPEPAPTAASSVAAWEASGDASLASHPTAEAEPAAWTGPAATQGWSAEVRPSQRPAAPAAAAPEPAAPLAAVPPLAAPAAAPAAAASPTPLAVAPAPAAAAPAPAASTRAAAPVAAPAPAEPAAESTAPVTAAAPSIAPEKPKLFFTAPAPRFRVDRSPSPVLTCAKCGKEGTRAGGFECRHRGHVCGACATREPRAASASPPSRRRSRSPRRRRGRSPPRRSSSSDDSSRSRSRRDRGRRSRSRSRRSRSVEAAASGEVDEFGRTMEYRRTARSRRSRSRRSRSRRSRSRSRSRSRRPASPPPVASSPAAAGPLDVTPPLAEAQHAVATRLTDRLVTLVRERAAAAGVDRGRLDRSFARKEAMALLGSSLFVQASARPAAAAGAARLARGAVPDARCAGVRRHVADGLAASLGARAAAAAADAWLAACDGERASLVAAATASAPPERWTDATFDVAQRTLAGGRVELSSSAAAAAATLTADALANLEARYVERPSRFCSRCLVVARTYEATLADAGQHGQLPAAAFCALRAWGCDFELFASPLNATLPRYCSLHASDVPFGSSGSFFDFDLAAGGNFEANPPFCLPAGAYFDVFERALDAAGDAVALSIALVVPETTDVKDRAAALRARGLVAANVRVPKGHAYRRGRSHEGAGPWTCPFGTYVTVLQTRAARLRWPAADLADRLYESFFADGGAPAPPRADRVFLYEARDDLDDASRDAARPPRPSSTPSEAASEAMSSAVDNASRDAARPPRPSSTPSEAASSAVDDLDDASRADDADDADGDAPAPRQSRGRCRFFGTKGGCYRGAKCPFAHGPGPTAAKMRVKYVPAQKPVQPKANSPRSLVGEGSIDAVLGALGSRR